MAHNISICYSQEDNDKAKSIHDSLKKIIQFNPHKAELFPISDENRKEPIKRKLSKSEFMILLLSNDRKNNQCVKQEIGEFAIKDKKNRPHIIPVSEMELKDLKSFTTKDWSDSIFLNGDSLEQTIAKIIYSIRRQIPKGLEENSLHFLVSCQNCTFDIDREFEYKVILPSNVAIEKVVSSNPEPLVQTSCPRCHFYNDVDIRTLKTVRSRPEGLFNTLFT